jgi:hypothetical protein
MILVDLIGAHAVIKLPLHLQPATSTRTLQNQRQNGQSAKVINDIKLVTLGGRGREIWSMLIAFHDAYYVA